MVHLPGRSWAWGKGSGWFGEVVGWPASLCLSRFEEENQRLLELNQRCQFASFATMQWLDIRLQLMGAAVVSAIAGIALVQHQQGLANPGATQTPHLHSRALVPVSQPLHLRPGFPVWMSPPYHHHPHFRVEETESPETVAPGVVDLGLE